MVVVDLTFDAIDDMQLRTVRPENQRHSILNFFPKKGQSISELPAPPKPAIPPPKARKIPVTRVQKSAPPTKRELMYLKRFPS